MDGMSDGDENPDDQGSDDPSGSSKSSIFSGGSKHPFLTEIFHFMNYALTKWPSKLSSL